MPEETESTQQPVEEQDAAPAAEPEEQDLQQESEQAAEPEQQAQFMTPEQVAEVVSRGTNDLKTWIGRRDKGLFDEIGSLIDTRLSQKTETPEDLSNKLLEDPVSTIKQIVNETQTREAQATQRHTQETFTVIGNMMDSDPLYQDKELGSELVEEVKAQFKAGNLNTQLPPQSAAQVLHAEALANVMRKRKGTNPLKGNTTTAALGNLQPGVPNAKPKPKMPKLSEETKTWAKKWGYKDKDLLRVFGDGGVDKK